MAKTPLFNTNPHLQDPEKYHEALKTSVASSTAIETGESVETIKKSLTKATQRGKRPVLHLKKKTGES